MLTVFIVWVQGCSRQSWVYPGGQIQCKDSRVSASEGMTMLMNIGYFLHKDEHQKFRGEEFEHRKFEKINFRS